MYFYAKMLDSRFRGNDRSLFLRQNAGFPPSRLCRNRKATLLSVLLMPISIAKKLIVTQSLRGGDRLPRCAHNDGGRILPILHRGLVFGEGFDPRVRGDKLFRCRFFLLGGGGVMIAFCLAL